MVNRWTVLVVLFFARLMMAFQYQSVAALSPMIMETFSASLADIGVLIGLYLGPGIFVAIPGASLVVRFGDRLVVGGSLFLMLAGGLLMATGVEWEWLMAGRVLAGIGGVVVNIVMTKMVIDWFAGREIGTAMGLFISSWPLVIALSLLLLPILATTGGLFAAWMAVVSLIGLSTFLFLVFYRSPPATDCFARPMESRRFPVQPLVRAAAIWALFNTALAMIFGFGPLLLIERGLVPTTASSVTGVFTIFVGLGVPLGGFLADRNNHDRMIAISLAGSACCLPVLLLIPTEFSLPAFAATGLLFGLAAGPIMTLPSRILIPEARALGMGVFFAIYSGVMMLGPALAGSAADMTGNPGTAFLVGAVMLAVSLVLLNLFRAEVRKTRPAIAGS